VAIYINRRLTGHKKIINNSFVHMMKVSYSLITGYLTLQKYKKKLKITISVNILNKYLLSLIDTVYAIKKGMPF